MKNYLDLIPISYKIHKKQSRMTRICIILAVFLITTIFGMAEMELRGQNKQAKWDYGEWHAGFKSLSDEQAEMISVWPEVSACTRYNTLNYRLNMNYQVEGTDAVIAGFDESALDIFPSLQIKEGTFPGQQGEVMVAENMKKRLDLSLGDKIILSMPEDEKVYTITGFTENFPMLVKQDVYGLMMNVDEFRKLSLKDCEDNYDQLLYVKFSPWCNIQKSIKEIQDRLNIPDENVGRNEMLLLTMGQSKDSTIMLMYLAAAVLAMLVSAAGILMIGSSLNSNVAKRTEFFGMLRCLGADRKQVIRFVRKEALRWCRSAVPIGLLLGVMVVWVLCAILKVISPKYFAGMPDFGISVVSLIFGAGIGVVTVMLASRAPARRAAKVSPLEAVSGNANVQAAVRKAAGTRLLHIDISLGIHHAFGNKKNFILMTGSFSFSIILFLAFTTMVDFMHHGITSLRPYSPDISVISADNTCSIDHELVNRFMEEPDVKRAYGRMFAYDIPAQTNEGQATVILVSYEKFQFDWAKDSLLSGDMKEVIEGKGVLTVYAPDNPIKVGDTIRADFGSGTNEVIVSGMISNCPFDKDPGEGILICSEEMFRNLTGEEDYTIIDLQLQRSADDETAERIRTLAGDNIWLSDKRMDNAQAKGTAWAFGLFVYGFLAVIALISVFNIVNSIAMSVSARMKQYGAMRAIGADSRQLVKMIAAQAGTYGICGIIAGCILGLPINRFLYQLLVTERWGEQWYIPFSSLGIIVCIVLGSVALAIYRPAKQIRDMSVVETISAQ